MATVQIRAWWWVPAGVLALVLAHLLSPLSFAGWAAGVGYLVVSTVLISTGLRRRGAERFGPANAVTATRSMLIGVVTAVVVTSFTQPIAALLLTALVVPTLALDAVDGWVARRTGTGTAFGARFDMEADAFLLLVLSAYDVRMVGGWILAIGLMRYVYVAVGWALPWMRATVPFRYWRKVVTAVCGFALVLMATGLLPWPVAVITGAVALGLLVESFGRDVIWLIRVNSQRRSLVTTP
ncbi:MAG: CDP-alcohol phosphatidyltransferase family protein [Pseudolysinimonas sp.]